MTNKSRDTFVLRQSNWIVEALVGLKNVRVLAHRRSGPDVELLVEQVEVVPFCPSCGAGAQVKDRPVVRYVDLPVFGTPMTWHGASIGSAARTMAAHASPGPQVITGSPPRAAG